MYLVCVTPNARCRDSSCAASRNIRFSASFWPISSPIRNSDCTSPSAKRCRIAVISVKSSIDSSPTAPSPANDSPPPFTSARLRNTSKCRASSISCVPRNSCDSKKSGCTVSKNRPGTSPAMNSTCVRNVHSVHIARSMSSG